MLKEYRRVRVKATGLYGTIVEWKSGSDHCEIELDWWQQGTRIDEDDLLLRTFALSEIDELAKAQGVERKVVLREFDTLVISFRNQRLFFGSPIVAIRRGRHGVQVSVRNWSFDNGFQTRGIAMDEGASASKLLSAVFATHADRWIEHFANFDVLDGYSWTMDVYSSNCYFECEGDNFVPDELVRLLCAVREMGLSLSWLEGKIGPSGSHF